MPASLREVPPATPTRHRNAAVHWALRLTVPAAIGIMTTFVTLPAAQAVPSFAEQTGQPCQACHVGGFGPQLTPFGREFKLGGYTMRAKPFNVPLAAMAIGSFTHTRADQTTPPDHFKANDNFALDQASLFLAGGVGDHFGGFAQVTYDGVGRHMAWDNLDLRAVTHATVLGQDAVLGLTLNNNPTTQDVWNSVPAWGFPYTDTAVSPTPGAAPLIDGALAQNVVGISGYAWIGQKLYLEAGGYSSLKPGLANAFGVDPFDPGSVHGLAPYGRIAWQQPLAGGTFEAGAFALKAAINPGRDRTTGYTDHYSDIGIDASWLKPVGAGNTITADVRFVHEASNRQASCALALIGDGSTPDCAKTSLDEWRGDVSYNWHGKLGATLGAFSTTGTSNADLYAPGIRPNSNGVMGQVDYTPWGTGNSPLGPLMSVRLGLQYTVYGKFDGARHNYDGAGANAADNNTLRLFTWVAF
ncbi:MAG: hypothetical protein KGN34_10400 [Sphingomonadales bacterium]|nr:hypothetical protein [Sphingomonadales bacterium]